MFATKEDPFGSDRRKGLPLPTRGKGSVPQLSGRPGAAQTGCGRRRATNRISTRRSSAAAMRCRSASECPP